MMGARNFNDGSLHLFQVTLLSQSAGEPEQLVLEYEQVRNELHVVKQVSYLPHRGIFCAEI